MVKKGYYGNEGLGLAWDHVKVFQGWFFWAILGDFWGMEKKYFRQKVGSTENSVGCFLVCCFLKKVLWDGWVCKKRYYGMGGFGVAIGLPQNAPKYTTYRNHGATPFTKKERKRNLT